MRIGKTMKPHRVGKCNAAHKIKWSTKLDALLAMDAINRKDKYNLFYNHKHTERRVYQCPDCGYWHLTSMNQSTYQDIAEQKARNNFGKTYNYQC